MNKLFVYGTLRNPQIREKIGIGKIEVLVPSFKVPHYFKFTNDQGFPDMQRSNTLTDIGITGDILLVNDEQLKKIDQWEEKYERKAIRLKDGSDLYYYKLKDTSLDETRALTFEKWVKQKKYFYHRTDLENLRNIMSNGLLQNPPSRVYSAHGEIGNIHGRTLETLGGIYFYDNIDKLKKYLSIGDYENGVVIVQANVNSMIADEDPIDELIDTLSKYLFNNYITNITDPSNDPHKKEGESYLEWYYNKINDNFNEYIKLVNQLNIDHIKQPALKRNIKNLFILGLENTLKEALKWIVIRPLSYISDYPQIKTNINRKLPNSKTAEKTYRNILHKLSHYLKNKTYELGGVRYTLGDIGFSGETKITGIVLINYKRNTITLLYGKIPDELINKLAMDYAINPTIKKNNLSGLGL